MREAGNEARIESDESWEGGSFHPSTALLDRKTDRYACDRNLAMSTDKKLTRVG